MNKYYKKCLAPFPFERDNGVTTWHCCSVPNGLAFGHRCPCSRTAPLFRCRYCSWFSDSIGDWLDWTGLVRYGTSFTGYHATGTFSCTHLWSGWPEIGAINIIIHPDVIWCSGRDVASRLESNVILRRLSAAPGDLWIVVKSNQCIDINFFVVRQTPIIMVRMYLIFDQIHWFTSEKRFLLKVSTPVILRRMKWSMWWMLHFLYLTCVSV